MKKVVVVLSLALGGLLSGGTHQATPAPVGPAVVADTVPHPYHAPAVVAKAKPKKAEAKAPVAKKQQQQRNEKDCLDLMFEMKDSVDFTKSASSYGKDGKPTFHAYDTEGNQYTCSGNGPVKKL